MGENSTPSNAVGRVLMIGLDKAITIHQPVVAAHVRRVRERHPMASPSDIIGTLEKQYVATVIATGTAAGGVAAAPIVGTAASIAVSVGETIGFLEASALFGLAVAEVHGEKIDDLERRRTLLLAVLLGDSGASLVEKAAGRTGKHWGKLLTDAIPMSSITKINKVLGRWFVTKYGTKQGIIVIGRLAPFGIGGIGNALFGRTVVAGARRAFGEPPADWPADVPPEDWPTDAPPEHNPLEDEIIEGSAHAASSETSAGEGSVCGSSDNDEGVSAESTGATHPSLADELAKLADLYSSGLLTTSEFEQAKRTLLGDVV